MDHPWPLFHFIFNLFKQTIQILQVNVKKCPSSIRWWDINSRPLEHQSSSKRLDLWQSLYASKLRLQSRKCEQLTSNERKMFIRLATGLTRFQKTSLCTIEILSSETLFRFGKKKELYEMKQLSITLTEGFSLHDKNTTVCWHIRFLSR